MDAAMFGAEGGDLGVERHLERSGVVFRGQTEKPRAIPGFEAAQGLA